MNLGKNLKSEVEKVKKIEPIVKEFTISEIVKEKKIIV